MRCSTIWYWVQNQYKFNFEDTKAIKNKNNHQIRLILKFLRIKIISKRINFRTGTKKIDTAYDKIIKVYLDCTG